MHLSFCLRPDSRMSALIGASLLFVILPLSLISESISEPEVSLLPVYFSEDCRVCEKKHINSPFLPIISSETIVCFCSSNFFRTRGKDILWKKPKFSLLSQQISLGGGREEEFHPITLRWGVRGEEVPTLIWRHQWRHHDVTLDDIISPKNNFPEPSGTLHGILSFLLNSRWHFRAPSRKHSNFQVTSVDHSWKNYNLLDISRIPFFII